MVSDSAKQDEKMGYLSTIQIFRDLTPEELTRLDRPLTTATCRPGKVLLYAPGESGKTLFLLKKGQVQLYRLSPAGEKSIVATLGPGAVFGAMPVVGRGMYDTYAEAVGECTLCVMSRSDVERLLKDKPPVAQRFMETLGNYDSAT
jgi:CRP-like cAMP-binding protein